MDTSEQIRLMHAVLDGEATADEVSAVEAFVASDPAARVRY
jgi:anti-sigma factor RsiW